MNLFKPRNQDPDLDDDEESIEGERALTPVNKGLTLQNKLTNWAVMCAAVALAAVLLYNYYSKVYDEYKQGESTTKDVTRTVATNTLPPLTMPDPEPVKLVDAVVSSDGLPPLRSPESPTGATGAAQVSQAPVKSVEEVADERRLKREVRFSLDGGAVSSAAVVMPSGSEEVAGTESSISGAAAGKAPRAAAVTTGTSAGFSASRAYMLPDPTLMITRGKGILCTVIPAIDTTLTGMVTCVTAEDTTGADNKVSLMDRGTLCTGQQGGGVTNGQRRVGIVWQRCETPQHVLVPLDSGAADSLGRPGIPGVVDNHFWDRFGSAIALSLISDIGPYLIATRQGGNNNTTIGFPNITGPQEVMSEVLKSTMNIPPTISAPQGAQVLIYLTCDIDFRDVYQLERTK